MSGVGYDKAFQQQIEINRKWRNKAEQLFTDNDSIVVAIEQQIFPNICHIRLKNGGIGMGYYIAPNFLVTNAHVLPTYESIQESCLVAEHGMVNQSFHRPDRPDVPDVVVLNISDPFRQVAGIKLNFSSDESLDKNLLFFINYSCAKHGLEIVPVEVASAPGELPLKYKCLDDSIPQPGCSGTPVIEARVILGREPSWQFRQVGMVYARCNAINYDEKLLCALPINFDLDQIYQLQTLHEETNSLTKMALAASSIKDKIQHHKLLQEGTKISALKNSQFIAYIEGQTDLDIELPEGLEKLNGSGIISLSESLLLYKNQQSHKKIKFKVTVSSQELQEDLNSLFTKISSEVAITLRKGDNFFGYDFSKLFRIDICENSKNAWKVDLQDNTGKRLKISGKPSSSVFAIVIVPKDAIPISGNSLIDLFKKSMLEKKACEYVSVRTGANIKFKKQFTKD